MTGAGSSIKRTGNYSVKVKVMNDLIAKAWKVINSCQTIKQAQAAMRYLDLLSEQHPDLDVTPLQKELSTLFDMGR